MPEEQAPSSEIDFIDVNKVTRRSDEFEDLYANNVLFESTAWDLRMIFGQLKTGSSGEPKIEQHTSITIPWPVAKIACIYLALNIIGFEEINGADSIHLIQQMLGMLRLNEHAKADPRIMTIFTALMSVGNPEIFSKPVVYEESPDAEAEPIQQRHVKPNREPEDNEKPLPGTAAPKGSRQIRFEEDEQKPAQNPDERMEIG